MLIPLTRKTLDDLLPQLATGDQYRYHWGNLAVFLRRLSISLLGVMGIVLINLAVTDVEWLGFVLFVSGIVFGTYWLWAPIYFAGKQNRDCRQYQYGGFWQGEVWDVFITEEVVSKQETVNKRGELVVIEDQEPRMNLEVGDEIGFSTVVQVPFKREYRSVRPGDTVEMILLSNRADLSRINWVSDVYVPECNVWLSDYPFVRRDVFAVVRRKLRYEG